MASSKATNRGRHRARRSEGFGVRRWLKVGAASAGMGAALFVVSLTGPQVGVAAADDTGQSSSSAGSDAGVSSAGGASSPTPSVSSVSPTSANEPEAQSNSEASDPAAGTSTTSTTSNTSSASTTSSVSTTTDKTTVTAQTNGGTFEPSADRTETASASKPSGSLESATPVAAKTAAAETNSVTTTSGSDLTTSSWALGVTTTVDPRRQVLGDQLGTWTNSSLAWVDSLPVADDVKWHLDGALFALRRGLLNLTPTVAPVQFTGSASTPISGRITAVDPEGDQIVYRLVQGPRSGTLQLNDDGSFSYAPGTNFDGVDSFVVMAQDLGLHVNLLDPFRGAGASAGALVNQEAIKFAFDYTTGADIWTPARRAALKDAADAITTYFLVTKPVTLSYSVAGTADPQSGVLASAGSGLVGFGVPAFHQTVVQYKLTNGIDANGAAADGILNWNWGYSWALGDSVGSTEFDFRAIVLHELLHSFGFTSYTDAPGMNTGTFWTVYDGFIVDADGDAVITKDYTWDTAFDQNLTGADGGLYFAGPNAVAAYGGPVPVYTPDEYSSSSVTHLDDATFTGDDQQLMNAFTGTGPRLRVLSSIELGILKDLGYTVVDALP